MVFNENKLQKVQKETKELWRAEQERIAGLRVVEDRLDFSIDEAAVYGQGDFPGLSRVAGVDLSFFPDSRHAVAAVVVLSYPEMEVLHEGCAVLELSVPYVPGYLAFREVPALAAMLLAIDPSKKPQVVFVDGNGAFHPRKCGAAVHLGVVTDLPAIGVAKDVLLVDGLGSRKAAEITRTFSKPGDWAPFAEKNQEPFAALVQPGSGSKALVVSPGHRICLRTAVALVRAMCPKGVVEPVRQADLRSRRAVTGWLWGMPLPELPLSSGPEAKRRRRRGNGGDGIDGEGGAVAKLVGPGAAELRALLQLLPGAAAAAKGAKSAADGAKLLRLLSGAAAVRGAKSAADGGGLKKGKGQLVWKPKFAAAVAAPVVDESALLALLDGATGFDVPEYHPPRECCSWDAFSSLVRWAFFG